MEQEKIKEAFQKVRQDIDFLHLEVSQLRKEMIEIVEILQKISAKIENIPLKQGLNTSTQKHEKPTLQTHSSTHQQPLDGLKPQNMVFSTGNQGASTDRQTDRQTDRHTPISYENEEKTEFLEVEDDSIDSAAQLLESLDNIKKDLRLKFKRLTEQELLVFSALYQLDEETGHADYKTLAEKLNLTESSIRDYVGRLIKKKIPVEKIRINNKYIQLRISKNLKKIASLSTILQLRDI